MKDIKELEAKYIELGKEIEKFEAEQPKDFPRIGDKYYCIAGGSAVGDWYMYHSGVTSLFYTSDDTDEGFQSIGNFFQFKEQALAELETRKVIAELKKCNGAKKFVKRDVNWCLCSENKHIITIGCYYAHVGLFNIYFDSEESVQEAINKVGEQRIINAVKWQAEWDYSWV